MTRPVLAAVALLAFAACSSPTTSTAPAGSTPAVAASTSSAAKAAPTPTPTPVVQKDATTLANLVKQSTTTKIVTIDENNDPNDKIGRPGGYISAAIMYDSTVKCTELGTDCGAGIEVFPTAAEAQARADYIQGILKSMPALGNEYDTVVGAALLRVSGKVKPSLATLYAAAMTKA
jgi:hypothetical protein